MLEKAWAGRSYVGLYTLFKRIFEGSELAAMARFIEPGSTVIDVGANVGFTSVFFSRRVGAGGTVVAIEPDPVNVRLLKGYLARNGCENVVVAPVALGDCEEETLLHRNLGNRADSRLSLDTEAVPHRKAVPVHVQRLPTVLAELEDLPEVSFIKVDTQGHEVSVLRGMREWLRALPKRPVLALECWPYGLRVAGVSLDALFEIIDECGYDAPPERQAGLSDKTRIADYESILFFPKVAQAS